MVFSLHTRRARVSLGLLVGIMLSSPLHASDGYCNPDVFPFTSGGQVGVSGNLWALTAWNGELVAGGSFATAGGRTVNRIARWDGLAWQPFFSGGEVGVNSSVQALTVWNGELVAGGSFAIAGGQTVNYIARWDGAAWQPFTSGGQIGVSGDSWALTVWNGDLIAAGQFQTAGGQTVNNIARWDGSAWQPFTSGGQIGVNSAVFALTEWNGDLIAAGGFQTAGGQTVNRIARWDGTAWHPLTSGGQIGVGGGTFIFLTSLAKLNGDLITGGNFQTAGGQTVRHIARWDGAAWHPLSSGEQIGVSDLVEAMTVWNGDLIAGGAFQTAGGQTVNHIARWDGTGWHPFISGGQIGLSFGAAYALTGWNGDLVAGGTFQTAGGQTVTRIARWQSNRTGACCINGVAIQTFADDCAAVGGVYFGAGVASGDVECDPMSPTCPGDLNGDGVVDVSDLLILLGAWGFCP